jgi:hypothetical protein
MGLAFIAYSDLPGFDLMVYFFLAFFGAGVLIYRVAERGGWHRKYLDYRALAEGLRVQCYWIAAGVPPGAPPSSRTTISCRSRMWSSAGSAT